MFMGSNGCAWVRMDEVGRGGHGEHRNKTKVGHLGSHRLVFGPYGRENFPGHDVVAFLTTMVKDV